MTVRSTGNQRSDYNDSLRNTSWMSRGFGGKFKGSFPFKFGILAGAVACFARWAFLKFNAGREDVVITQSKRSFEKGLKPMEIEWAEYRDQILSQAPDKPLPRKRYTLKRYKMQPSENL